MRRAYTSTDRIESLGEIFMKCKTVTRRTQDLAVRGTRLALLTVLVLTASLGFGQSASQTEQGERSFSRSKMAPALERLAIVQAQAAPGSDRSVRVIV